MVYPSLAEKLFGHPYVGVHVSGGPVEHTLAIGCVFSLQLLVGVGGPGSCG